MNCAEVLQEDVFFVFHDSLESELENLREALLKARLDPTPPKTKSTTPGICLCIFLK